MSFVLYENLDLVRPGSLLTVRSSIGEPMATDTAIISGSHTIILYPGATVKILADGFCPLSGRLEISSNESDEPLKIFAARYSGEIYAGNLLLEVTPDSGTFIVMQSQGRAWFKDLSRKIFELQSDQQLHFPIFGATVEQNNPAGFWSGPPSSFSSARRRLDDARVSESSKDPLSKKSEAGSEESDSDEEAPDKVAGETSEKTPPTPDTVPQATPEH